MFICIYTSPDGSKKLDPHWKLLSLRNQPLSVEVRMMFSFLHATRVAVMVVTLGVQATCWGRDWFHLRWNLHTLCIFFMFLHLVLRQVWRALNSLVSLASLGLRKVVNGYKSIWWCLELDRIEIMTNRQTSVNGNNQANLTLVGWLQGGVSALVSAGIKYWHHP